MKYLNLKTQYLCVCVFFPLFVCCLKETRCVIFLIQCSLADRANFTLIDIVFSIRKRFSINSHTGGNYRIWKIGFIIIILYCNWVTRCKRNDVSSFRIHRVCNFLNYIVIVICERTWIHVFNDGDTFETRFRCDL